MTTRVVSAVVPSPLDTLAGADHLDIAMRRLDPAMPIPTRAHPDDAGVDLATTVDVTIAPGARVLVGTGLAVAVPPGFVGLIHPRSGLAARVGLSVLNAPGTVDSGYRGEIKVCLINHDAATGIVLHRGDRIAQLLVQRVAHVHFTEVEQLPESVRGAHGHGSTGVGTLSSTTIEER